MILSIMEDGILISLAKALSKDLAFKLHKTKSIRDTLRSLRDMDMAYLFIIYPHSSPDNKYPHV